MAGDSDNIAMLERKASVLKYDSTEVDLLEGTVKDKSLFGPKLTWLTIWLLATVYLVATLIITPASPWGRVVFYMLLSIKVVFEFVPLELVTNSIEGAWMPIGNTIARVPSLFKGVIGGILIACLVFFIAYGFDETKLGTKMQRSQSLLGIVVFIALMAATSHNFRSINWHTVASGIFLQLVVGLFVMKTKIGEDIFTEISRKASKLLGFSSQGCMFIFGQEAVESKQFAYIVLPAVLFFASLVQILYYLGVMQWIITKSARFFKVLMDTTVCESVVAAASPSHMTRSELHQVMTSGFSTIAGSVLIAFIGMKIDAKSLITSCVMSIPCSLALSKLRYPETEESKTKGEVIKDHEERESNILHAAANGAAQGITLCLLIGGTLLAIISLLALTNAVIGYLGSYLGKPELTLKLMGSYLFWPFAWLVGIPRDDCFKVGSLLATKLFANEFVAYSDLKEMSNVRGELDSRSAILATYALCGFANFASIGIQVGCLGAMAPSRKRDLAELAMSSMITGTVCTFVSACIAGLLI
ncbi:hypothetical protein L0F63_004675 [Massospora cicadina]|nr:hypothetical protein L0F63_004675 [Massospora cicadina]